MLTFGSEAPGLMASTVQLKEFISILNASPRTSNLLVFGEINRPVPIVSLLVNEMP